MRRLPVAAAATFALFLLDLVLVLTRWHPLRTLDTSVADHLSRFTGDRPSLVSTCKAISDVGQPATFQALAVLVGALLWWRGHRPLGVFCAVTVPIASLLSTIVKLLVRRTRPDVADDLTHAAGTSFPSGHATTSFAGVLVLLVVLVTLTRSPAGTAAPDRRVRSRSGREAGVAVGVVIGVGIAGAVAASRLFLGVHYVSDVVAGWLLATTWVLVASALLRSVRERPTRRPPAGTTAAAPGPPPAAPAA